MQEDDFFNKISLQLIDAPPSSRQALLAARSGATPANNPAAAWFPVESARSWANALLAPAYRPPESTLFLAFPMENGLCDTVRAIYTVEGVEVEIAQTQHLISIAAKRVKVSAGIPDRVGESFCGF
jgi:hypothetical protein